MSCSKPNLVIPYSHCKTTNTLEDVPDSDDVPEDVKSMQERISPQSSEVTRKQDTLQYFPQQWLLQTSAYTIKFHEIP